MKAVMYLRMSSNDQGIASVEQQKKACDKLCRERKYQIVDTFIDEGKSGSKNKEKRVDFMRMLHDATKNKFNVIVCWDSSRFSRMDSHEQSEDLLLLRNMGVTIDTVQDGKIDLNTSIGRLMSAMKAENDNEYSRRTSANGVRGRNDLLAKNRYPHGLICYGYARQYTFAGQEPIVISNGQKFRKPREWKREIIIDENQASVVRWIYRQVVDLDRSINDILRELNKKQIPSPHNGKAWTYNTVYALLRNPHYKGVTQPKASTDTKFNFLNTDAVECFRGIIGAKQWEECQKRLDGRSNSKGKPRTARAYALSGVLYCGNCGCSLQPNFSGKANGTRRTFYKYYRCQSPERRVCDCSGWSVKEPEILYAICKTLVEQVDFEMLKTLQAKPLPESLTDLDLLDSHAEQIKGKIKKATERLVMVDAEMIGEVQTLIKTWKEQLKDIERKIAIQQNAKDETALGSFVRWWSEIKNDLLIIGESSQQPEIGARDIVSAATEVLTDGEMADYWESLAGLQVMTTAKQLRGFLRKIGCEVTLFWRERTDCQRMRGAKTKRKMWAVDWERCRIKIGLTWYSGMLSDVLGSVSDYQHSDTQLRICFERKLAGVIR